MKSWSIKNNRLCKSFHFQDFKKALQFINEVGSLSEELNHHPKISNLYNSVDLELWTHSENKITSLDHALAFKIDNIEM